MENMEKDLQRGLYIDCLTKQLEEINLLSSIFCNPGELQIHDPSIISDFNEFVEAKTSTFNSLSLQLDFSIFIMNPLNNNEKIEIRIELPHLYPLIEIANVTIRNSSFTKSQENFINKKLDEFINDIDKSEPYIYQIYIWIQDNLEEILKTTTSNQQQTLLTPAPSSSSSSKSSEKEIFERLWIYSHHIKSKTKRQEIQRQAKDLQLTGFCRPGKPGIICVEGLQENTQEFWRTIKSMHWQKIQIKKVEIKQRTLSAINETSSSSSSSCTSNTSNGSSSLATGLSSSTNNTTFDISRYRRFTQFKEELFTSIGSNDENIEEKMDMSLFMKFLELHNCGYMKKELFGFD